MQAYKIICKAITDNPDPIICQYIITYNKKLDVIEILQKININGKSILQNTPVWPKIETNNSIRYCDEITHNANYPKIKPEERIILEIIKTMHSKDDTIQCVSKIIKHNNNS